MLVSRDLWGALQGCDGVLVRVKTQIIDLHCLLQK